MKQFDKFEALREEKQRKIINTGMNEFLKGGYEKASMNALVEAAGISKGALFYYFDNKRSMYLYLFEKCENMVFERAKTVVETMDSDFISRMEDSIKSNIELLHAYPLIFKFMKACKKETSDSVCEEIQQLKNASADRIFGQLYKDINRNLFRVDLDITFAIYTIKTTMFQIVHDHMDEVEEDTSKINHRINNAVEFFRQAFYKEV